MYHDKVALAHDGNLDSSLMMNTCSNITTNRIIRAKRTISSGCYAVENGLVDIEDWEEGWLWFWKGRRNAIVGDIVGARATNFAGHVVLQPKIGNDLISFGPRYKHNTHFDNYTKVASGILQKNRQQIIKAIATNQLPGMLDRNCPCPGWALEAGITIHKVRVMYSPSRLTELLDNQSLMSQCRYCWNVEIDKKKINCVTVFYVWNVIKNMPFTPSMKEFHNLYESHAENLSSKDIQLAMSKLDFAEKDMQLLLHRAMTMRSKM